MATGSYMTPIYSRSQTSAHAENEGVNELLRHCCPFVLQRQSKLPNRCGGKVRAAKSVCPRKSHTCWMGLRSEIVPANPYVQYPHSLRAVRRYCAMTWCIVVHEKNSNLAPLKTHIWREESRYNNGSR
ncbi:hypothetical protein TNCV_869211 [Trichonephila clavipes]|nr:hypothetical protein TNCV_869211 [Trichonephila clavipes]